MRNIFICILAVSLLLTWQSVHAWNPPSASEQRDAIDGGLHVGTALLSATSGDTVFHAASYDFKTGAESRVTRKKVGSYWFTYDSIRTSQSATWKVHKSIGMNDSTYLDLDSLFAAHVVCSLLVVLNDISVTDSGYFGGHLRGNKSLYGKDSVGTAGLFYGVNSRLSGWGIFGATTDTLKSFLTLGGYEAVRIDSDTLYIGLLSDSVDVVTSALIVDQTISPTADVDTTGTLVGAALRVNPGVTVASIDTTTNPHMLITTVGGTNFAQPEQYGDLFSSGGRGNAAYFDTLDGTTGTIGGKLTVSDSLLGATIKLSGGALIGGMTTTDITGNITSNNSTIDTLGALHINTDSMDVDFFLSVGGVDSFTVVATTALYVAATSAAVSGSHFQADWVGPGAYLASYAVGASVHAAPDSLLFTINPADTAAMLNKPFHWWRVK